MRLKLGIFHEFLILTVSQQVTEQSVKVLLAGFMKVLQQQIKVRRVLLDLTAAELTESTRVLVVQLKPKFAAISAKGPKIQMVSKLEGIGDFKTMEEAMGPRPSPEGRQILEKLVRDAEADKLRRIKVFLDKAIASGGGTLFEREKAIKAENGYLKKMYEILQHEWKTHSQAVAAHAKRGVAPTGSEEMSVKRTEILEILKKMGVVV